jgi:hypothetical protein
LHYIGKGKVLKVIELEEDSVVFPYEGKSFEIAAPVSEVLDYMEVMIRTNQRLRSLKTE